MKKLTYWFFIALTFLIASCGGGGGGGGASGNAGIFITDDLNSGFKAVWVTLFKVELEKQGGGFVTVFDDPNGKVINLRALSDGNPRYAFLGKDRVPEGVYTGIRFSFDKDVHIVPNGSDTAVPRTFDDSLLDPNNPEHAILSLTFSSSKTITATSSEIVTDFVLSSWTENGTKIQNAILSEGNGAGLDDPNRHDEDGFKGTISGLTGAAPDLTFTLNLRSNNAVTVTTNSQTSIFNNNGAPNPTLANGKHVEVRGTFNPSTDMVLATSIKIKGSENDDDEAEVKGATANIVAASGTFDVELGEAERFVPTETSVHVTTSLSTHFFSHGGILLTKDEFFAALQAGMHVEVEGTWTEATNTLAAVKAKIEDEEEDEHEAEAKGTPNTIDATASTFRIQLVEWEGFSSTAGTQINVTTSGETEFRGIDGETLTKDQFFTQLATATSVKVEGVYNSGTIAAREARIREGSGGGGEDHDQARGATLNVNASAKTFDMVLVEWSGFNGSANLVIHVQMSAGATFRGFDGETIAADAFFSQLVSGQVAEVEGTFNSNTNTLTAVKAKLED